MSEEHYCRKDPETGMETCDHECPECGGEFFNDDGTCEVCGPDDEEPDVQF